MSLLAELKETMPVLHTLMDGIDEAIGAPVESLIGIVGDMDEDVTDATGKFDRDRG